MGEFRRGGLQFLITYRSFLCWFWLWFTLCVFFGPLHDKKTSKFQMVIGSRLQILSSIFTNFSQTIFYASYTYVIESPCAEAGADLGGDGGGVDASPFSQGFDPLPIQTVFPLHYFEISIFGNGPQNFSNIY